MFRRAETAQGRSHHSQKYVQRFRILAAQATQSLGARIQNQRRQFGALTVGRRGGGNPLMETRSQRCLRLGPTLTPGCRRPIILNPIQLSIAVAHKHFQRRGHLDSHATEGGEQGTHAGRYCEEFRRGDADHSERNVIDEDRLFDERLGSPAKRFRLVAKLIAATGTAPGWSSEESMRRAAASDAARPRKIVRR